MTYRRRYLSGQQATTVVIAEGAITSDKIVDGAVIHPKVAPDAIDSERVIDESLKSVDIKDGEIKTPDLQDGAVTTPKIATAAVTPEKLSVSVLTRPISPGVNTAELLDANVTLAKLAPNSVNASKIVAGGVDAAALAGNAVETAKVKDAQITLAKMAPDSIDNTVIKANTIRGTEIGPGACGESELGADSVVTVKVKDSNITLAKLAANSVNASKILADAVTEPKLDVAALSIRHRESLDTRVADHKEEFGGIDISNRWRKRFDAGGFIGWVAATGGVQLLTPATTGKKAILDWNEKGFVLGARPLSMSFWLPQSIAVRTYQTRELGLATIFDMSGYILFTAEDLAGAVPNWFARCKETGAETSADTGIAVTEAIQLLTIEYISDASVKFYIDGAEVAEITTNIPTGTLQEPYIALTARSNAARTMYVRMMSLLRDRPDYA